MVRSSLAAADVRNWTLLAFEGVRCLPADDEVVFPLRGFGMGRVLASQYPDWQYDAAAASPQVDMSPYTIATQACAAPSY